MWLFGEIDDLGIFCRRLHRSTSFREYKAKQSPFSILCVWQNPGIELLKWKGVEHRETIFYEESFFEEHHQRTDFKVKWVSS